MRSSATQARVSTSAQSKEAERIKQTIETLRQLLTGDEREHRRTFMQLRRSLDAGRSGFRRLLETE